MKQKIEVEVEVPDGWELTGEYRAPTDGESILNYDGYVRNYKHYWGGMGFILRRVEPEYRVFKFTGEHRTPKAGELYSGTNTGVYVAALDFTEETRDIMVEVTDEVTIWSKEEA